METRNRKRKQEFENACMNNSTYNIEHILNNDINKICNNFGYFIEIACRYGKLKIIKYLIECGDTYKINMNNYIVIIYEMSCSKGYIDILMYIIEYCKNNNINYYKLINTNYIFCNACRQGYINIIKCIIDTNITNEYFNIHCWNEKAFRQACNSNNVRAVKYLIEYCEKNKTNININVIKNDAIISTLKNGNVKLLEYVIKYLDKYNCNINTTYWLDYIFYNIFHSHHFEIIQCIIKYSERINKRINISIADIEPWFYTNTLKYLIYLYKHNYNINSQNQYVSINNEMNDIFIIKHIVKHNNRYSKKYNSKYIYNNNIVCNIYLIDTISINYYLYIVYYKK